ncbi:hypothetical protein Poli38472_006158 [Pythium oligandrum]|uniref:SAM domain-containing protein n=1 Tax=Pythium oligandrum TaxID=41045 RepID=A0A8K1CU26_PYTOL|nr:hypothetical protein Poli38472_006158 [Pythium oligandrum]|eukprot:TMW68690.1 hypothetical protein Poli38472_006158 [Pythium oligandrum]
MTTAQPGQIFRDSLPVVDPAEPRTSRLWEWVCSALVDKDKGDCVADIVDTVFLQKDQIWSWFYATSTGLVRRKPQRKLTIPLVHQRFLQIASAYDGDGERYAAVCCFDGELSSTRIQLLTSAELQTFLTSSKGHLTLSAFVAPRGGLDPMRYANLEHECTLHKSGKFQTKLYRLAMGSQRVLSMDQKLNALVNDVVQTVISAIARTRRARVVHCVSLFVLDDYGRVFLWRTDKCETVAFPPMVGSTSTTTTDRTQQSVSYDGPNAINERLLARAKAEASRRPDDKLIQAILSSPTPAAKRQPLLLGSSTSQPVLPSSLGFDPFGTPSRSDFKTQLRNKADWDNALQYLPPTSALSKGRRRTISAAHLASSQKKGCCGDYCDLVVSNWAAKRLESKVIPLSTASMPALEPISTVSPSNFSLKTNGGRSNAVSTATAAAQAFLSAHPETPAEIAALRKPMSPQRQQQEDRRQEGTKPHTIPFKLIAQTRAEKQLVDLFMRRYQKGEDGDYLAEEYYGDGEPLGETFPGYYYQEVQVCKNCFDVYTLVENVRMKALEQIALRRRRKSRRSSQAGDRSPTPANGISGLRALREEEDDQEVDDETNDHRRIHTPIPDGLWKRVWSHAQYDVVPSITKMDSAELYSFVSPHPAVAMVLSALGILLLGRKDQVAPAEVKRLVPQEKLVQLLQLFTLEDIPHESILCAATHARNPLFTPVHVGPVSSCAARFCNWILTALQAYAWRHKPRFKGDDETWRVLAFLKPELLPLNIAHEYEQSKRATSPAIEESQPKRSRRRRQDTNTHKSPSAASIARKAIQEQQMARLTAPSGMIEAVSTSGVDATFTCSDGMTQIPYTVTGHAVGASTKCNLVVFHDFFDTMESTKLFFRAILAKHVGARALFFNLPGQAGTNYPTEDTNSTQKQPLNNLWLAHRVHELLAYLQHTMQFITAGLPFHILGFGNGANVATSFATLYSKHESYVADLQSLVLVNGFANVDAQLAAILHSTVNVFSCLPPSRPDLPVTFFCKYLFSEQYLAKIDANLALSIYTAVTNPITLDGRVRICQGALHHVDLVSRLGAIDVPLVLVQSVENALVAPTNVDPFLQGRVNIAHAWSHQQATTSATSLLNTKTRQQLHQVLATRHSAFVSWLRAGHELRQEAKAYLLELFEFLVCSKERAPLTASEPESPCPSPTKAKVPTKEAFTPGKSEILSHSTRESAQVASVAAASTEKPAAKASNIKSAYELQLERSEQAFQEAMHTQEKQKQALKQQAAVATVEEPRPRKIVVEPTVASVIPVPSFPPVDETPTILSIDPPRSVVAEPAVVIPATSESNLDDEMQAIRDRIKAEEARMQQEAEAFREKQRRATEERMEALRLEQERRRRQWEEEDNARLAALEKQLQQEQVERDEARRRRETELLSVDTAILATHVIEAAPSPTVIQSTLSSVDLIAPTIGEMKQAIRTQPELPSLFDQMEAEERAKKRVGKLRVDEFDQVKTTMSQNFNHNVREHESTLRQELFKRKQRHAVTIQKHIRRFLAAQRVFKLREARQQERIRSYAGGEIVRIVRGFLGRRRFLHYKRFCERVQGELAAAIAIQRLFRGFVCRVKFHRLLRKKKAMMVQRVYRGYRGREYCRALREAQAQRRFLERNATKLQATWRMHAARDRFLTQRIALLAAIEIQRMYRGHVGRREAKRKKAWHDAEPGPERLALGLKMIEGSKQAFERQQNEIDALHRAQEAVERQVSTIHAELQESEKELAVLERELQEIDQLEADLRELTHEAEMLHNGGLEGLLRSNHSADKPPQRLGSGVPPQRKNSGALTYEVGIEDLFEGKTDMKKRQADAYAVEMAIQIKRAEREKKKKDLEAEFTSVFAEVQQKRAALSEMEEKLADMEATRMRKDREFARMQRNLMELLEEQKLELENLREKGIELEAATATSAAAAAATAMKAKEHEKRSQAMFESTEELMKFQFMSMSLSYFSSLNMLKNLRDINADTTAAAITSTAETAAAAAAAAAAANIPTMKRLQVGGTDLMMAASQLKKNELERKLKDEEEAKKANQQPLPEQIREWTVDDVGRWLDTLSLTQYKTAFHEGAVDGEFLLELRPEDMSDVLGVTHKLHVRKILVARNKLLPLSEQERMQISAVMHEEDARNTRNGGNGDDNGRVALDMDTVFSQARNGRLKRLIESIDAGFDINSEDDKGNTLLLIACQNVNMKMVEYLVAKRANVNHKNAQGNTPLHFAMAYDSEGKLGEYLIAHGSDDTIENSYGLTAYDGLTPE